MGSSTDTLCLAMAAVYSFFGVTLAISMRDFWGTNSPGLTYWTVSGDDGQWFARGLGVWMTAVTLSPWWMGMPKELLAKLYLPINAIFMVMFIHASFFLETTEPPESNILPINMWWTQLPIAAFILFTNIQAVGEIESKSKKN